MINDKKVAAIIAEYNPFHNGHEHHIKMTKSLTGADYVVILMSGNFVQRGEPAIIDRYIRAESALSSGADAVFELPVTVSTGNAEIFAKGSVSLAESLGFVDFLSFGTETDDITKLTSCAELLCGIKELNKSLKIYMKKGLTYPEAREAYLRDKGYDEAANILKTPNNILAVSYFVNLINLKSNITPVAVKRESVGHNEDIDENKASEFASAKAIRDKLLENDIKEASKYIPEHVKDIFNKKTGFIKNDDFSDLLYLRLSEIILKNSKKESVSKLASFHDVSTELAARIYGIFKTPLNYSDFAAALWSRNYTYARMDRVIWHIILGITKEIMEENEKFGFCPYIRPLAIKRESLDILGAAAKNENIPLITRISDIDKSEHVTAVKTFGLNRLASSLYAQTEFTKHGIRVYDETKESFMMIKRGET